MSDHVYKKIELTGSSTISIEDAIQKAVERAAKTIRNMRWFEVVETRGYIEEGLVSYWQVTIKIGFTMEDGTPAED
jgi:flavin-binding protein dodecin